VRNLHTQQYLFAITSNAFSFHFSFYFLSDKLELISQQLTTLAKDQGSTDNITIVTVFLRPIEEIQERKKKRAAASAGNKTDDADNNNPAVFEGITSTSSYVQLPGCNMNGSTEQALEPPSPQAQTMSHNPFAAVSSTNGSSAFDDPFSSDAAANNSNSSAQQQQQEEMMAAMAEQHMMAFETSGEFKRASPSMFDSPSTFENSGKESGEDAVDFMANQENSWIGQAAAANPSVAALSSHPFLPSTNDSGFISPACASNNASASSEDSAENHAERETSPESDLQRTGSNKGDDEDEDAEAAQVAMLLATAGGSGAGASLEELMSLSDKDDARHTPPMEDENGNLNIPH
jgi:hypothetical protein